MQLENRYSHESFQNELNLAEGAKNARWDLATLFVRLSKLLRLSHQYANLFS
jgi:hypothetical protein